MAVIRFLGQSAFAITSRAGKTVYVDPWLTGNPVAPLKLADVTAADVVCVTHGHGDHLGDALAIVRQTGATLVCTPEMGRYAAQLGIKSGEGSYPMHIGGSANVRGVTVYVTDATHSAAVFTTDASGQSTSFPATGCVGFVLEVEPGVRIYHAGDTGLFGDMRLIAELYEPTVALLPIGGRYTMGPREAAIAAEYLAAPVVIPMHFNAFANDQRQDAGDFVARVAARAPQAKVVVLQPGETYET